MPRIPDLLDVELIVEDLQAADNTAVIREFASFLKNRGKGDTLAPIFITSSSIQAYGAVTN